MNTFVERLSDDDEGMRWWAIVGLHLLDDASALATPALNAALADPSHEVRMIAAWTLVKLGEPETALECLDNLLFGDKSDNANPVMLHNVIDWIGEPALPLVRKYIASGATRKGRYGIGILGRIAQLNGF